MGVEVLTKESWYQIFDEFLRIQEEICSRVKSSRQKDFDNQFFQMTYDSTDEMNANLGTIDTDPLINLVKIQTSDYKRIVNRLKKLSN